MIVIFTFSLLQIIVACLVRVYLLTHKTYPKIKIRCHYFYYKSNLPTTYFIIKSKRLLSEQMNAYLRDIRARSEQTNIIIIGNHIDYEELYRNHYRVFGVIDLTNNKYLIFINNQTHFYLDSIYG